MERFKLPTQISVDDLQKRKHTARKRCDSSQFALLALFAPAMPMFAEYGDALAPLLEANCAAAGPA